MNYMAQIVIYSENSMKPTNESEGAAVTTVSTGVADTITSPPKKFKKNDFMNCAVFEVDGKTYNDCITGWKQKKDRFSKHIKNEELLTEIREYAKTNPSKSILLYGENCDSFVMLKRGKECFF